MTPVLMPLLNLLEAFIFLDQQLQEQTLGDRSIGPGDHLLGGRSAYAGDHRRTSTGAGVFGRMIAQLLITLLIFSFWLIAARHGMKP